MDPDGIGGTGVERRDASARSGVLRLIMVVRVRALRSGMRRRRTLAVFGVGLIAGLMIVSAMMAAAGAGAVSPSHASLANVMARSGDPIVKTNWAGYGVVGVGTTHPITAMLGSWIEPSAVGTPLCPTTGVSAEAIGAGLNTGAYGGVIDGVGTLIVCVLGTPLQYAWVSEGSVASVVLPITGFAVHSGDVFQANVTLTYWVLSDVTTGQVTSGTWTTPVASSNREAECVVGRASSMLGLTVAALPTSSPTTLVSPVYFGTLYTGASNLGCWYYDIANGAYYGLGAPAPGWHSNTFELKNPPPAAALIVPGAPLTGVLAGDSFNVP